MCVVLFDFCLLVCARRGFGCCFGVFGCFVVMFGLWLVVVVSFVFCWCVVVLVVVDVVCFVFLMCGLFEIKTRIRM